MTARILVTGSREWTAVHAMRTVLRGIGNEFGDGITLVHGAARGADRLAASIAEAWGWHTEAWLASWDLWGRSAGPKRNQSMVDEGADVCLAFLVAWAPCNGTRDCARHAEKASIPVRWFTQEQR